MTGSTIDTLTVQMLGDTAQYVAAMESAATFTTTTMAAVETTLKQTEQQTQSTMAALATATADSATKSEETSNAWQRAFMAIGNSVNMAIDGMKSFAGTLKSLLGNFASFGLSANFMGGFEKAVELERNAARLSAVIGASGRAADLAVASYAKFADQITRTTLVTKGAVFGLVQQAEALGLQDAQAQKAIRNAIALAAVQGGAAESYLRLTAALEQGHAEPLARMLPSLRGIKDDAEQAAKAQELLNKMFAVAESEVNTTYGQMERLKRSLASFNIETQALALATFKPLIEGLVGAVSWFKSLPEVVQLTTSRIVAASAAFIAFANVLPLIKAGLLTAYTSLTSFIGMLTSPMGLAIGAFLAAAAAITAITLAATGGFSAISNLNDAMKESARLSAQLEKRYADATGKIFEQAKAIKDLPGRKTFVSDELDAARKQVTEYNAIIESIKRQTKSEGFMDVLSRGTFSGLRPEVKAELNQYEGLLKKARERAEQLGAELKKLSDETDLKKLLGDIEDFNDSLLDQIHTYGLGAPELERYRLAERGASDDMLAMTDAFIGQLKAAEDAKKLNDSVDQLTESLREQVAVFGLSGREAEVAKLAYKGATEEQLIAARVLSKHLDGLEAQAKLFEEGDKLMEKFADPQTKFAQKQEELNELLESGAIDFDVYSKAIAAARSEIFGATRELQKFDAAAASSAEAITRVQKYMDQFQTGFDQPSAKVAETVRELGPAGKLSPLTQPITNISPTEFDRWQAEMLVKLEKLIDLQEKELAKEPVTFGDAELEI